MIILQQQAPGKVATRVLFLKSLVKSDLEKEGFDLGSARICRPRGGRHTTWPWKLYLMTD